MVGSKTRPRRSPTRAPRRPGPPPASVEALAPGASGELVAALAPFGFAEYEARAYAALLARQPATAYEVARAAGIPDSKIYRSLEKLAVRGVVTAVDRDPATFAALPPEALAGRLEATARRGLQDVRRALEHLDRRESPVAAWPLAAGTAVLDRAAALLAAATARVDLACGGAPLAALAGAVAAARERGVQLGLSPAGAGPDAAGREPFTLVADDEEAVVARLGTTPDGRVEGRGLASREPALVESLAELLARRRGEERDTVRPAAPGRRPAPTALASLEKALAPGRLDIC